MDARDYAKLDTLRHERTGIPEVILAEGKLDEHLAGATRDMLARTGRALVSRLDPARAPPLRSLAPEGRWSAEARFLALGPPLPRSGARVLILAAGTADVAVAEEARLVAEELGCETRRHYDVGVAGLHRLFPALDDASWADVLIVAAGREGALATVVAGLVDRPVIGLPVSVGYGMGGKGEAALLSMLQACAPLAVVNIDAGFVAGALAAQIANRVARARNSPGESRTPQRDPIQLASSRRE